MYNDKSFDAFPKSDRMISHVQIQLKSGRKLETKVLRPTGVKAPLSRDEIIAKFKKITHKVRFLFVFMFPFLSTTFEMYESAQS